MRRRFLATLVLALVVLLMVPALAQAMTYKQAVDKLIKQGWPQAIEKHLLTFESSAIGFRAAGTPADNAQARYIARVMKSIGLAHVRLEAVPIDVWNFKGASVTAAGTGYASPVTYTASSFGGVPGTPAAGVTGDVVYVHGGSAADFAAAGNVAGKVVLVDFEGIMWWMSYPEMEAGLHGAKAVILTHSDDPTMAGYYDTPAALGSFDAETQLTAPPMVYISWNDGDALKAALAAGPVTVNVKNHVTIKLTSQGGKGYNVLGEIRGSSNPGQMVVYGSHHDAWFHGALDNASAVVNELLTAKAMKMSGYRPQRTIVFFSSTGEEYGVTQSYYDWCIGAWYNITHRHPDWAGKVTAFLNSELLGYKNGNLWMLASPEITPALNKALAASKDLTLTKNSIAPAVIGGPWSWNDQWTFSAAGVPSVCFWSQDNAYSGYVKTHIYHTPFDNLSQIDWNFLGNINTFEFRVARKFAGSAPLPYDFTARADDLAGTLATQVSGATLGGLTYDQALAQFGGKAYGPFAAAVARFAKVAAKYHPATIPAANCRAVDTRLLAINKLLNANLTGMDWLDNTTYPFKQTTFDIAMMSHALGVIAGGGSTWQNDASADVGQVGLMWYGINFSHAVFAKELERHRPWYYHICWGGQGHLDRYQDLMPEYNAILAGNAATATSGLTVKMNAQIRDLRARLVAEARVLNCASGQIQHLLSPVAKAH